MLQPRRTWCGSGVFPAAHYSTNPSVLVAVCVFLLGLVVTASAATPTTTSNVFPVVECGEFIMSPLVVPLTNKAAASTSTPIRLEYHVDVNRSNMYGDGTFEENALPSTPPTAIRRTTTNRSMLLNLARFAEALDEGGDNNASVVQELLIVVERVHFTAGSRLDIEANSMVMPKVGYDVYGVEYLTLDDAVRARSDAEGRIIRYSRVQLQVKQCTFEESQVVVFSLNSEAVTNEAYSKFLTTLPNDNIHHPLVFFRAWILSLEILGNTFTSSRPIHRWEGNSYMWETLNFEPLLMQEANSGGVSLNFHIFFRYVVLAHRFSFLAVDGNTFIATDPPTGDAYYASRGIEHNYLESILFCAGVIDINYFSSISIERNNFQLYTRQNNAAIMFRSVYTAFKMQQSSVFRISNNTADVRSSINEHQHDVHFVHAWTSGLQQRDRSLFSVCHNKVYLAGRQGKFLARFADFHTISLRDRSRFEIFENKVDMSLNDTGSIEPHNPSVHKNEQAALVWFYKGSTTCSIEVEQESSMVVVGNTNWKGVWYSQLSSGLAASSQVTFNMRDTALLAVYSNHLASTSNAGLAALPWDTAMSKGTTERLLSTFFLFPAGSVANFVGSTSTFLVGCNSASGWHQADFTTTAWDHYRDQTHQLIEIIHTDVASLSVPVSTERIQPITDAQNASHEEYLYNRGDNAHQYESLTAQMRARVAANEGNEETVQLCALCSPTLHCNAAGTMLAFPATANLTRSKVGPYDDRLPYCTCVCDPSTGYFGERCDRLITPIMHSLASDGTDLSSPYNTAYFQYINDQSMLNTQYQHFTREERGLTRIDLLAFTLNTGTQSSIVMWNPFKKGGYSVENKLAAHRLRVRLQPTVEEVLPRAHAKDGTESMTFAVFKSHRLGATNAHEDILAQTMRHSEIPPPLHSATRVRTPPLLAFITNAAFSSDLPTGKMYVVSGTTLRFEVDSLTAADVGHGKNSLPSSLVLPTSQKKLYPINLKCSGSSWTHQRCTVCPLNIKSSISLDAIYGPNDSSRWCSPDECAEGRNSFPDCVTSCEVNKHCNAHASSCSVSIPSSASSGVREELSCTCDNGWEGPDCGVCADGLDETQGCSKCIPGRNGADCIASCTTAFCHGNSKSVAESQNGCVCTCASKWYGTRCEHCGVAFNKSNSCSSCSASNAAQGSVYPRCVVDKSTFQSALRNAPIGGILFPPQPDPLDSTQNSPHVDIKLQGLHVLYGGAAVDVMGDPSLIPTPQSKHAVVNIAIFGGAVFYDATLHVQKVRIGQLRVYDSYFNNTVVAEQPMRPQWHVLPIVMEALHLHGACSGVDLTRLTLGCRSFDDMVHCAAITIHEGLQMRDGASFRLTHSFALLEGSSNIDTVATLLFFNEQQSNIFGRSSMILAWNEITAVTPQEGLGIFFYRHHFHLKSLSSLILHDNTIRLCGLFHRAMMFLFSNKCNLKLTLGATFEMRQNGIHLLAIKHQDVMFVQGSTTYLEIADGSKWRLLENNVTFVSSPTSLVATSHPWAFAYFSREVQSIPFSSPSVSSKLVVARNTLHFTDKQHYDKKRGFLLDGMRLSSTANNGRVLILCNVESYLDETGSVVPARIAKSAFEQQFPGSDCLDYDSTGGARCDLQSSASPQCPPEFYCEHVENSVLNGVSVGKDKSSSRAFFDAGLGSCRCHCNAPSVFYTLDNTNLTIPALQDGGSSSTVLNSSWWNTSEPVALLPTSLGRFHDSSCHLAKGLDWDPTVEHNYRCPSNYPVMATGAESLPPPQNQKDTLSSSKSWSVSPSLSSTTTKLPLASATESITAVAVLSTAAPPPPTTNAPSTVPPSAVATTDVETTTSPPPPTPTDTDSPAPTTAVPETDQPAPIPPPQPPTVGGGTIETSVSRQTRAVLISVVESKDAAEAIEGSSSASAGAAGVISPTAATYATRLSSILRTVQCAFSDDDDELTPNPMEVVFTNIDVGSSPLKAFAGAVVAASTLFLLVPTVAVHLLYRRLGGGRRSISNLQDSTPSMIIMQGCGILSSVFIAYFAPNVVGGIVLILAHPSYSDASANIGAVYAVFATATPIALAFYTLMKLLPQAMGSFERAASEEESSSSDEDSTTDDSKKSSSSGGGGGGGGSTESDVDPNYYLPQASSKAFSSLCDANAALVAAYLPRHLSKKLAVHTSLQMSKPRQWYFLEELFLSCALAVCGNIRPSGSDGAGACTGIAGIMLLLSIAHLAYLIRYTPYDLFAEKVFALLHGSLQLGLAACCVALVRDAENESAAKLLGYLALGQGIAFIVQVLVLGGAAWMHQQKKSFGKRHVVSDDDDDSKNEDDHDGRNGAEEPLLGDVPMIEVGDDHDESSSEDEKSNPLATKR